MMSEKANGPADRLGYVGLLLAATVAQTGLRQSEPTT
jgi:hypothetical protein